MDDVQKAFLEIVTNVRGHLEFQKALGVSVVEMPRREDFVRQQSVGKDAVVLRENDKIPPVPSLTKGSTEGTKIDEQRSTSVQTETLAAVRDELSNCTRCKLNTARKNIVFGDGDPAAMLVIIGEWPGPEEDEQGKPFMGPAGQLLTDIIVKGMKLKREDIYICNVVKCKPPDDRNPEQDEIEACEPFLIRQLQAIKPRIIVALGDFVVKALLKTDEGIAALRGKWQKYQGILLMPTLHPADLLKNPADKKFVWEDIKKVIIEMGKVGKR